MTYKWLPARSTATSKYMIVMFDVEPDFAGVASVEIKHASVVVHEKTRKRTLHTRANSFL
jgi:hypothetical protein